MMDKKTYVKRLKKMLTKYGDTSCSHCPGSNYYNENNSAKTWGTCAICQEFIGLPYFGNILGCPCHRLDPEEAIKRVWKAIGEYEKIHGEVK